MAAPAASASSSASASPSIYLQSSTISSATDRWISKLKNYPSLDGAIQKIILNKLPWSVLSNLYTCISTRKAEWLPHLQNLKIYSVNQDGFIEAVHRNDWITMESMRSVARKINALVQVDACFTQCPDNSIQRNAAHLNTSMGFIRDLDDATLVGIAIGLAGHDARWKLFADGLGFETNELFNDLPVTSYTVLKRWITRNPNGTLFRLHFEAKLLQMDNVCDYLEAIPLEGIPRVRNLPRFEPYIYPKVVTRYHLERLEHYSAPEGIHWHSVSVSLGLPPIHTNQQSIHRDVMWQLSSVNYQSFLKTSAIEDQTMLRLQNEVLDGIFEPTSPGGITYSQMVYLSEAFNHFNKIKELEKLKKAREAAHRYYGFEGLKPGPQWGDADNNWESPLTVATLASRFFIPNVKRNHSLSFKEFFFLFWQYPVGANLNLTDFCTNMMEIMRANKGEKLAELFEKLYLDLKPMRSYDEQLGMANNLAKQQQKQQQMQQAAASSSAVAIPQISQRKEGEEDLEEQIEGCPPGGAKVKRNENGCRICFSNDIEVVILPCAHFGYCLRCLETLATCPSCAKPIQQKVTVIKV